MSLEPTRELVLKKLRDRFPDPKIAADALLVLDTYNPHPLGLSNANASS